MSAVSKTDAVCLAILLLVDISVYAWSGKGHFIPVDTKLTVLAAPRDKDEPRTSIAPARMDTATTAADTEDPNADSGLWEHAYGDYVVKSVKGSCGEDGFVLEVFKAGQLVFTTNSNRYFDPEEQSADSDDFSSPPAPNTDITGGGFPNLVVAEWSGGAHCCLTYYVFQLGDEFRLMDTIQAEHGDAHFEDLDGDEILEIKMQDWTYAYEFTCYAGSPAPPIILRYTDGKYQVAPELMFTDPPTEEEFAALVQKVRDAYSGQPEGADEAVPPGIWGSDATLWQKMLELTYKGHLELAMKVFEACWHAEWKDKDSALNQYWMLVGSSPQGRKLVEAQGFDWPEEAQEDAKAN